MFASNRLTLFLILLLTALFGGARVDAANNPPPCTEKPYCTAFPSLSGTIEGGGHLCPEEKGKWNLIDAPILGKKVHCNITEDVGIHDVNWTWKLTKRTTGEVIAIGSGKTVEWQTVSSTEGYFLLTFTGSATGNDPCNNPIGVTVTQLINVPAPSCTVTFGTASGCPGEQVIVSAVVTNTSDECNFWFVVFPSVTAGNPHVQCDDIGNTIYFKAGTSFTLPIHYTILEDSPDGSKTVHVDVSNLADANMVSADGSVTLDTRPKWEAELDDLITCPGELDFAGLYLTNIGCKIEDFKW